MAIGRYLQAEAGRFCLYDSALRRLYEPDRQVQHRVAVYVFGLEHVLELG